jgi:hypothetical protein
MYTAQHKNYEFGRSWRIGLAGVIVLAAAAVGLADAKAGADVNVGADWQVFNTTYESGQTVWTPGAVQTEGGPSEILSPTTARLVWSLQSGVNELGTSIETTDVSIPIETVEPYAYFQFEMVSGSPGGGAPRMFVGIDTDGDGAPDLYRNTWDHGYVLDDDDVANTAVTLPDSGTVVHVGLVLDNAQEGTEVLITLSPVIDDVGVLFEDEDGDDSDDESGDGPPHDGGQEVASYVKANGGPPPHAKAGN